MPSRKKTYRGRVLTVKPVKNKPYTWNLSLPSRGKWPASVEAEVSFIFEDDMKAWETRKPAYLSIPAGFWQRQKSGKIRVIAPALGFGAPLRIPPGKYYIVVESPQSSAATNETVEIGMKEGEVPPPSHMEIAEVADEPPEAEFRRRGTKAFVRHRPFNEFVLGEWEPIPTPRPPHRPRGRGREKVDPFPDLQSAIPVMVSDIQRARRNIWIVWWTLEDDFPTQFNAAGAPTVFLRDEIKSALRRNPQLNVYMIVWKLPGVPAGVNPAAFCFPQDANRLHIRFQTNDITGSHHEKFLLCDQDGEDENGQASNEGAVLWCRGWDGAITYWDIHSHKDPDPYLDPLGLQHQPWHDTALRVVSERSSRTFENEFRRRWTLGGFVPPLPPPPVFLPAPVGQTTTLPLVHLEFTPNGPQERWYLATIPTVAEGLYFENQYFDDTGIANAIIGQYLGRERIRAIHGALVICHPEVMSPFFLRRRSRKNLALVRATTARQLDLDTAAGIVRVRRPPGGWTTVVVRAPLPLVGNFFHVKVTFPGGGAAGDMVRAISGVVCLTLVTPSALLPATFRPVYLHSKFSVLDGSYILGSTNIGFQSFNRDSETDVVVPDPIETKRVTRLFFPALVGGGMAPNLSTWINRMEAVAATNYDMEKGTIPFAPVGLLTEFPYE